MTRDEIIRMVNEIVVSGSTRTALELFERFADLVAAHVRETEFKPDWNNYQQGLADGAAAEREACAKLCEGNADDLSEGDWDSACINCADSIRARSEV